MTIKTLLQKLMLHLLTLALSALSVLPAFAAPTRPHHHRHHARRSRPRRSNTIEPSKKVELPLRVTVPFHVPPGDPQ